MGQIDKLVPAHEHFMLLLHLIVICSSLVGKGLLTEADEHHKIYCMKLWATNEVSVKSKFFFFEKAE